MQQLRERRALRWSNRRSTRITESSSLLVAFGSTWASANSGLKSATCARRHGRFDTCNL
jgi:hypothetical protein